jgi:CheY-like chemotaxis protein
VVDDNLDGALTLSMVLRKTGNEVQVAHNGEQAVEVAAVFKPDVVFMDLGMPIMDGFQACERMRADPWGQRARIVAVSGWGQEADRERSKASGFDEHMVKPIERHTLQRVIQSVAEQRQATSRGRQ